LLLLLGEVDYLVIQKLSSVASENAAARVPKGYHTVGIRSSAAYCGGKNVELVIAALNRGGFVRPPCAY
jgi:hypothetical protein